MKKKLLALILAATMAFPVCAFADDAEEETATEAVAAVLVFSDDIRIDPLIAAVAEIEIGLGRHHAKGDIARAQGNDGIADLRLAGIRKLRRLHIGRRRLAKLS